MGTNYYVRENECDKCGRYEKQHIGKASMGWKFLFNPKHESAAAWREALKGKRIFDEYGEEQGYEHFWDYVELKQKRDKTHWRPTEDPTKYEGTDSEGYRISKSEHFS